MFTFKQFLDSLNGKPADEESISRAAKEISADFPHGEVESDSNSVRVRCKLVDGFPACMKCGIKMNNRTNQLFKKGKWQPKAHRDNLSNWECPTCYPKGRAPIGHFRSVEPESDPDNTSD